MNKIYQNIARSKPYQQFDLNLTQEEQAKDSLIKIPDLDANESFYVRRDIFNNNCVRLTGWQQQSNKGGPETVRTVTKQVPKIQPQLSISLSSKIQTVSNIRRRHQKYQLSLQPQKPASEQAHRVTNRDLDNLIKQVLNMRYNGSIVTNEMPEYSRQLRNSEHFGQRPTTTITTRQSYSIDQSSQHIPVSHRFPTRKVNRQNIYRNHKKETNRGSHDRSLQQMRKVIEKLNRPRQITRKALETLSPVKRRKEPSGVIGKRLAIL